ncbi:MAG: UDP-N-acetylglucosamine 2-epimerase (non-hydrolyzing) [Crocinitomicaceae bacterium]
MHITIVAGTRPNFVKISPIIHAIEEKKKSGRNIDFNLVHTGQHYDSSMSDSFFSQLSIPEPTINLEVGSGTQAEQTGQIMLGFEKYLLSNSTDLVLVVGDVTSTMACAIVAKKLNIKLAHVEGGIRSFDMAMPEEINRKVTDSITDIFFTTSTIANDNLKKEGVTDNQIFFVGNVMIDSLLKNEPNFKEPDFFSVHKILPKQYYTLTLHRPSNVDNPEILKTLLTTIQDNSKGFKIIFPVHPRTMKIIEKHEINMDQFICIPPMSYLEFNFLVMNSFAVITDSGGITEETTVLGIPCLTLRENTERPETVSLGTNELIGTSTKKLIHYLAKLEAGDWKKGRIPELWDGKSAERIINHLLDLFSIQ